MGFIVARVVWYVVVKFRTRSLIQEYLQTLQQRHKWQHKNKNLNVGDVVLIVDGTMPPPSVQVVDLKTGSSELKRPEHKLVPPKTLSNEDDIDINN